MSRYKLGIHGSNLIVPQEGDRCIIGFYTTRIVSARDEKEAEALVKKLILLDPDIESALITTKKNGSNNELNLQVESVEKIPFYSGLFFKNKGFTFYLNG